MYAIVQVGSEQFKVAEGDVIEVNRLSDDIGKSVTFDTVLLVSDGKDVKVGQPAITGAKVEAEVLSETMGEKVVAFKYRRRKGSALKKGHREKFTAVKIVKIKA